MLHSGCAATQRLASGGVRSSCRFPKAVLIYLCAELLDLPTQTACYNKPVTLTDSLFISEPQLLLSTDNT